MKYLREERKLEKAHKYKKLTAYGKYNRKDKLLTKYNTK